MISRAAETRGLGQHEPQKAPPASDAGRRVAKRRRGRREEVRRLPPSRAHSTNAAPQSKKHSEYPTETRANLNATGYTLEVRLLDFGVAIPASLDRNAHGRDLAAFASVEDSHRRTRTSHGWSGPDATDGAAGGAVASAALRPRSPVAAPDTSGLRRNRVAPDAATRRPARPCSRCRHRPFFGRGCLP